MLSLNHKKRSGAVFCPSCGKLVSADSPECLHCGFRNPGRPSIRRYLRQIFGRMNSVVDIVIGACIALYVLSLLIDPAAIFNPRGVLGLFAPSGEAVGTLGATGYYYANLMGRWWTLLTAIYLHGNLLHILFNVLWIRQLGYMVEDLFGHSRTFVIFTLAGVFGFLLSNLMGIPATIGASGSIFGLLGALVYYGRKRGGDFGAAVYRQVGTWALILFFLGFMMPAVNNVAHAGGFIGGYLSALVLGFQENSFETHKHRMYALIAVLATLLAFIITFAVALF